MISYKSFCWSMGTTSFRTQEFNLKIEKQLELLSNFWDLHHGENWTSNDKLQSDYYDFMKDNNFLVGNAPNKPKDAREKTSGLIDIGLITNERRLTQVGKILLDLAKSAKFQSDNLLQIPADSYIYFKQFLKSSCSVNNHVVRPYIVLAQLLHELDYLNKDEFTFLLPLITNESNYKYIRAEIAQIRSGLTTIDNVICDTLMQMDNYTEAKTYFMGEETVSPELICKIGMNRKSRNYDKPYFSLYVALRNTILNGNENVIEVYKACKRIKIGKYWIQHLFQTNSECKIKKQKRQMLTDVPILKASNETELKELFFNLLHVFKAKATLADYYDLNKRYFGTTDTILFRDNKVEFDTIPKCFFQLCNNISEIAFSDNDKLFVNSELKDIIPNYNVTEQLLYDKLEKGYGVIVHSLSDVRQYVDDERHKRFNKLIDNNFDDDTLLTLLNDFEIRNDDNIRKIVTNNADVPTIFEYIVGIIWYKISNRQGKILDYMNLSLDADLLPKTHAAGGGEDITYEYEKTSYYPKHTLLIELTLADKTNQRRMEMEPVSRHLGDYLLKNQDLEAYALFVTTFLHINVISDFRNRKKSQYYSNDGSNCIESMKIIPFQTSELKTIVSNKLIYSQLYSLFEQAFQSTDAPNVWYENNISRKLLR